MRASRGRTIVVIGAGVVGAAVADELTMRGETDVTVLDRGALFATGGSSSHAPGLISRTSPSKMMQLLADHTWQKFASLDVDGAPAALPVGTLEIARTPERLQELWRRHNVARSWGWRGRMVDAETCASLWPIIDPKGILSGYATEGEGLAVSLRAVEAQARRATSRGARFVGNTDVTGIEHANGRVSGVRTRDGVIAADVVVCAAGVWSPVLAEMVGLTLPMVAFEHQYAVTSPVAELAANAGREATLPIVRHHDAGVYLRDHGDRVGIGSFNHRRLPVAAEDLDTHPRRQDSLVYGFTPEDFAEPWELACELMPALGATSLERSFNGVFAFTPDGYPLLGEHPALRGFWVAASVWVTHSAGVGRALAEILVDGGAWIDVSPADLSRFEDFELDPAVFEARSDDSYRDVYAVHHPAEGHTSARDLRFGPFAHRQRELGAAFFDAAAWERPRWYEANVALGGHAPPRDEWPARFWSPIVIAEHLAVRARAGLFDMTPLTRIEVGGAGAESFLSRMCAGRIARPPGTITYTAMLDERGGIRSDITVARVDDDRFVLGGNSARDLAWLRAHAPADVELRRMNECCVALWGPAARDVLAPLTDADLSNDAFPYMHVRTIDVAGIPVTAGRISYAGELGWELTADATAGLDLWDRLWGSGRPQGLIAAGTGALKSLRLEKGYRAWGTDMTTEHAPAEAGLAFCVRDDGVDFIGREALGSREPASRRLAFLVLDDSQVVMGGDPVTREGADAGYVTSAEYGPSVGRSVAFAWLPSECGPGDRVEIDSSDRRYGATVTEAPLFDPTGSRLRA